jgi:hypothetical protein
MNSAITRRGDRRGAIAIALVPYACSPSVDRVELPRPVDDAARVAAIETPTRLDARLVRAGAPLPTLALDGEPAELYVVDLGATADSLALDPTLDRLGDDAAPPYRTLVGARAVWRRRLDDDGWRELGAPSVAVRQLRLPLVPPCAEVHPLELYRARTGEPLALVEDFGRVWVGVGPSTWFELVGNALVAVAPLVEGLTVTASMRSSDDAATVIAGRRDRFDELWARRRGERDWRRIASVEGSTRAHARIQWLSSVHEDLNFTLSLDGHLVRWRGATATPLYRAPAPALGVEGEGEGEVAAPNANRVFIVEPFDPSSDDDRFLAEIATDDGRLLRRVGVVPKQLWTIGYIPALGDLMIGGAVGPPIALSQFASTPTGIGITLSAIRQIIPASQGPWRGYASVDNGGSVRLYWRGLDLGLSTTTIGRCELTSLGLAGERIVQKGYGFAISARDSEPPYETLLFWLEPTTP